LIAFPENIKNSASGASIAISGFNLIHLSSSTDMSIEGKRAEKCNASEGAIFHAVRNNDFHSF
jgi:hypothetical protein